ncbi:MAG: M1 family aminopeptidase [Planctomycetota bacterium]|nr:M1 family aminopeptidase [Planctomycetota bacterium]
MEFCAHAGLRRFGSSKPHAKPFRLTGHHARYLPDRVVHHEHLKLELLPNFKNKSLSGNATLTVVPCISKVKHLEIDQRELIVHQVNVSLEGKACPSEFHCTDDKLILDFEEGQELRQGKSYKIHVVYESSPRWGLHFVGPDPSCPKKPKQLWTLSQEENSRYWFPCFDHPDIRTTLDLIVTTPSPMIAVSNGELVSKTKDGDLSRFHWHMEPGLPPYLITLVIGEFAVIEDSWKDVSIRYIVPKGREEEAKQSLGRTPEMVDFLSRWTDMPYPYKRYDQVVVHDYLFGGMEHTTATTLTERTLRDERALLDSSSEALVSHELAHQWFGNTVTCREWPEGWLNEGFATYCENLWMEFAHGPDEARYNMLSSVLAGYLSEASDSYIRPIVERHIHQPIDLFDAHLYNKGAVVLNYLRYHLGNTAFQKSIQRYLKKHAHSTVDSHDLKRAVMAETSRRCDQFFDQWVFGPGHVALKTEMKWNASTKVLSFNAKQTQNLDGVPECFHLDFDLDILVAGEWQSHRLSMTQREQSFSFALPEKPKVVSPDPRAVVPGPISWNAPESMLIQQLADDHEVVGQIRAARALGSKPSRSSIKALHNALENDPFWGVAREAAKALGKLKSDAAKKALLASVTHARHHKTRRAIVKALGNYKGEDVARALKTILSGAASIFVEAEAARSLGKTRSSLARDELQQVLESRDSWHDLSRAGAITGLASLGDAEKDLDTIIEWSGLDKALDCRTAACRALKTLASTAVPGLRNKARLRLEELVNDPNFRVQLAAIGQLGSLGDSQALNCLEAREQSDVDGRVRRSCREAILGIQSDSPDSGRIARLEALVKKQQGQVQTLRHKVTAMESLLKKSAD